MLSAARLPLTKGQPVRRLPLLSLLLLAACAPQVASTDSPASPPPTHHPVARSTEIPTTVADPTTTLIIEEDPELISVLEARVTATTIVEDETTTTAEPAPQPKTTAAPTTTKPPAPSPTPAPTQPAGGFSSSMEQDFAGRINGLRGSVGVAALTRSGALDDYARAWAKQLAKAGKLSHSNFGSLLGTWSTVGENVGYGGSVSQVFSALVNSGGHYANMVAPEFTNFGVGVYVDSKGVLWTAHVFAG